jgi:hypothetical protein
MSTSKKCIYGIGVLATALLSAPAFAATNFVRTDLIATRRSRRSNRSQPGRDMGNLHFCGESFGCQHWQRHQRCRHRCRPPPTLRRLPYRS